MVERQKIGIPIFLNSKENSGVTNYVINILFALKTLKNEVKPIVIIYYTNNVQEDLSFFKSSNYEYLNFVSLDAVHPQNLIKKAINKFARFFFKKNIFINTSIYSGVDFFYPFWDYISELTYIDSSKRIHWLVDFNSYYFPEYYSTDKLNFDQNWKKRVVESGEKIVLSSYSSKKEFEKLFPLAKNEVKVLQFAVSTVFDKIDINFLLNKFQLPNKYFVVLNQFWPHKNHQIVIESLLEVTKKYKDVKIVFTGNLSVDRKGKNDEKNYLSELYRLIDNYELKDKIIFTGHLDRNEQLNLMNYATAIIQPSFYEGWNTSVEEGKCLNKIILMSDIEVHREQMNENCYLFDPNSSEKLAELIVNVLDEKYRIAPCDYNINIEKYGLELINLNK